MIATQQDFKDGRRYRVTVWWPSTGRQEAYEGTYKGFSSHVPHEPGRQEDSILIKPEGTWTRRLPLAQIVAAVDISDE